jgi:hypothetical protein
MKAISLPRTKEFDPPELPKTSWQIPSLLDAFQCVQVILWHPENPVVGCSDKKPSQQGTPISKPVRFR